MTVAGSAGAGVAIKCRPAATVGYSAQTAADIICGADMQPVADDPLSERHERSHAALDALLTRMNAARMRLLELKKL